MASYVDNIEKTIKSQWLDFIKNSSIINNVRITDYAKDVAVFLDTYDPSLFNSTENRDIQLWMRNFYNFLYKESFVVKRLVNSNWHAHRLWIMSKLAIILKNPDIITILRAELKNYIQISILDNNTASSDYGILIDTVHRDSIAYHVYTLFAILNTIVILEKDLNNILIQNNTVQKRVLWSPDTSLRKIIQPAIIFLQPYLNNTKTHIEYVNSQIATDKNRSEFGKPYNVQNGLYLYRFMDDNDFL